jgi:hypothetical protein
MMCNIHIHGVIGDSARARVAAQRQEDERASANPDVIDAADRKYNEQIEQIKVIFCSGRLLA